MLVRLRHHKLEYALPPAQFVLVCILLAIDVSAASLVALAILLGTGLYGWLRATQHARLILDTPTARIASAAQGYNELRGRAQPLADNPVFSPVNGLPVLWYRTIIERRGRDGKWQLVSTSESDASFMLEDDSGRCLIDPDGAEMLVRRRDVTVRDGLRYTQWALIRHDHLYVLGDFATLGSVDAEFNTSAQIRDLLAAWKADHPSLLARFDLDGNGELDLQEWELARAQAKREVRRLRAAALQRPEIHVMRRPDGRRLYLISDLDPARLARNYARLALFHLAIFLGAAAATAWFHEIGAF